MIGIAGSEEKCSILTDQLGFDVAINYNKQNIKASKNNVQLAVVLVVFFESSLRKHALLQVPRLAPCQNVIQDCSINATENATNKWISCQMTERPKTTTFCQHQSAPKDK